MHDYTKADLDEQTRGMLDFTLRLTVDPSAMKRSDVEHLRGLGLRDEEILSTVLITCVFNFMTRLADGLGVEFPMERQAPMERWMTAAARQQEWLMTPKD